MTSDTGQNRKPGTFHKGDPRINRKGRPRSFDALRELAQQIGHETLTIGDKRLTVTEAILRQWAQSKNPQLQRAFIEIAYGKVPDKIDITSGGEKLVRVEYVNTPYPVTELPPGASENSAEPKEV